MHVSIDEIPSIYLTYVYAGLDMLVCRLDPGVQRLTLRPYGVSNLESTANTATVYVMLRT